MERIKENIDIRISTEDIALINTLLERDKERCINSEHKTFMDDNGKLTEWDSLSCPICNSTISHGDKFCRNCGQRLDTDNIAL